jgi:hypothetical protein
MKHVLWIVTVGILHYLTVLGLTLYMLGHCFKQYAEPLLCSLLHYVTGVLTFPAAIVAPIGIASPVMAATSLLWASVAYAAIRALPWIIHRQLNSYSYPKKT